MLLALLACVPSLNNNTTESGSVLQEWIHSHGATRQLQLSLETGELLFIGEADHGLDWYAPGEFWWCSMGAAGDAPILSMLLRESTVEHAHEPGWYPEGLPAPYNDASLVALLPIEPLRRQRTFANASEGASTQDDAYEQVEGGEAFLYQATDDVIALAVSGLALPEGVGLGDGTENRDNGVRVDIAYRATIDLPASVWAALLPLTTASEAYTTRHPEGF